MDHSDRHFSRYGASGAHFFPAIFHLPQIFSCICFNYDLVVPRPSANQTKHLHVFSNACTPLHDDASRRMELIINGFASSTWTRIFTGRFLALSHNYALFSPSLCQFHDEKIGPCFGGGLKTRYRTKLPALCASLTCWLCKFCLYVTK